MKRKIMTLCFVFRDGKILLGEKKDGLGKGYINGYGGKMKKKDGGDIEKCMRREFGEESKARVGKIELIGIVDFSFSHGPTSALKPREYRSFRPGLPAFQKIIAFVLSRFLFFHNQSKYNEALSFFEAWAYYKIVPLGYERRIHRSFPL